MRAAVDVNGKQRNPVKPRKNRVPINPETVIHPPCLTCGGAVPKKSTDCNADWLTKFYCGKLCASLGRSKKVCGKLKVKFEPGIRFGKLTTVSDAGISDKPVDIRKRFWICRCDCGILKSFNITNLRSGNSKSCGKCVNNRGRHQLKPPGESNARHSFCSVRRGAESRNLSFCISFEEFKILSSKNCYYCGALPSNKTDLKHAKGINIGKSRCNGPFVYNGIDRKDNMVGYVLDNCVTSCFKCNRAKSDMSYNEFVEWAHCVSDFIRKNHETATA